MSNPTYLKMKLMSLAAEATIIRKESNKYLYYARRYERKHPGLIATRSRDTRLGLDLHRKNVVRKESRCSNIAYAFLRGRSYSQVEAKCYTKPDWEKVEKLIERFSGKDPREMKQKFSEWKEPKDGSVQGL